MKGNIMEFLLTIYENYFNMFAISKFKEIISSK